MHFPKPEDITHKDEFYKELPKKPFEVFEDSKLNEGNINSWIKLEEQLKKSSKDIATVEMPNGHVIYFSDKYKMKNIENVAEEYYSIIEQKAYKKRKELISYALLIWLIPCIGLYIISRGIAWAYRGFNPKTIKIQYVVYVSCLLMVLISLVPFYLFWDCLFVIFDLRGFSTLQVLQEFSLHWLYLNIFTLPILAIFLSAVLCIWTNKK
jgi:hypothetical protein